MRFPVRPELTTASAVHGLSLTTTATVDNSAPFSNHPLALIYRGQSVQINRATSETPPGKNVINFLGFEE